METIGNLENYPCSLQAFGNRPWTCSLSFRLFALKCFMAQRVPDPKL